MSCPNCGFRIASSVPLTKRQAEIYRFLVKYIHEEKHAPSLAEIGAAFGLHSPAVHEHLQNLEKRGYIRRSFNLARSIQCLVHIDEIGTPPLAPEEP